MYSFFSLYTYLHACYRIKTPLNFRNDDFLQNTVILHNID